MYKTILLLLSLVSLCCAENLYARAILDEYSASTISGSAAFTYTDSLYYSINITGLSAGPNVTVIVLNHGDLNKTPVVGDIYGNQQIFCEKSGFIGNFATDFITGSTDDLVVGESGSIIGLAVVVVNSYPNCSSTANGASTLGNILAWGVIGIGNPSQTAAITPNQGEFAALNSTGPNLATNPTTEVKYTATCVLQKTAKAATDVNGIVYFETNADASSITITAQINNLVQDSVHGIHIHTFGDLSKGETSIGGHWNNGVNQTHGLPNSPNRDYGDLGNVCVYNQATAYYKFVTDYFPLVGGNNIIGRSVALHANRDNGSTTSFGDRIAWCVIGSTPSGSAAPFTVPSSLTFENPPICAPVTPTPATPEPTKSDSDSSSSFVQASIFFIISSLLVLLI